MGGIFASSKFQYLITLEKGFVCTRRNVKLVFNAGDQYCFQKIMQTSVLEIWQ